MERVFFSETCGSRPGAQVLLGLRKQTGSAEDAHLLMEYLMSMQMGFSLLNITVTTHRVLSLIGSLLIGATLAFGPTLIGAIAGDGGGRGGTPVVCMGGTQ